METKIRQTQTFAPALPTPARTPHHSDNEENPCYSLRPRSSPSRPFFWKSLWFTKRGTIVLGKRQGDLQALLWVIGKYISHPEPPPYSLCRK